MLAVIMAAGFGTRMKSKHAKVMFPLAGKPIIGWVTDAVACFLETRPPATIAIVVGPEMEEIHAWFHQQMPMFQKRGITIKLFNQEKRLGTGHAVKTASSAFEGLLDDEKVLILNGDVPLVQPATLSALVRAAQDKAGAVLTMNLSDPRGYGRIIRNDQGMMGQIIEDKDLDMNQRAISEVNTGIYAFSVHSLRDAIGKLSNDNAQGEYYLPDVVHHISTQNGVVGTLILQDLWEARGVNNRYELSMIEQEVNHRVSKHWMLEGVTIVDPQTTYIHPTVSLGMDTIVMPMTTIYGNTHIGQDCVIGPMTQLVDCRLGNGVRVERSHCKQAQIDDHAQVGPFARLREGSIIERNARVGNYVELKKTRLGKGSKAQHLTYLGDAVVEDDVNVGAGTITCNYDGYAKYPTTIRTGAFIGSNTALVAPVVIGKGAIIGAGSTITRDVPDNALSIGRGRQVNKEGYAEEYRKFREGNPKGGDDRAL